jgi:hypothetical protein
VILDAVSETGWPAYDLQPNAARNRAASTTRSRTPLSWFRSQPEDAWQITLKRTLGAALFA